MHPQIHLGAARLVGVQKVGNRRGVNDQGEEDDVGKL